MHTELHVPTVVNDPFSASDGHDVGIISTFGAVCCCCCCCDNVGRSDAVMRRVRDWCNTKAAAHRAPVTPRCHYIGRLCPRADPRTKIRWMSILRALCDHRSTLLHDATLAHMTPCDPCQFVCLSLSEFHRNDLTYHAQSVRDCSFLTSSFISSKASLITTLTNILGILGYFDQQLKNSNRPISNTVQNSSELYVTCYYIVSEKNATLRLFFV